MPSPKLETSRLYSSLDRYSRSAHIIFDNVLCDELVMKGHVIYLPLHPQ